MSVTTTRDPQKAPVKPEKPLLHRYYTLNERLQVGDRALCGWVKKVPQTFPNGGINHPGYDVCIVCRGLDGDL